MTKKYSNPIQTESRAPQPSSPTKHKTNNIRDIISLKALMDKRQQLRGLSIYYMTVNKFQNAIIHCRQLLFTSLKVYKQYFDDYNDEYEQHFFTRTSKAKQHLQYLLDCAISSRVFLKAKKKEDAIDVLEKIEVADIMAIRPKIVILEKNQDKIKFNEVHQIHSKMCAVLLSFIEISKSEKIYDYCEKFFKIYIKYVRQNYSIIEYSTALFKYANYLFEIKQYEQAQEMYQESVQIRKKNVVNMCLVDSLINLSICQRELAKYSQAIKNTKFAIEIYKDIKKDLECLDEYFMFLGKLCFQFAMFEQAYVNFIKCYKYRQSKNLSDPARTQMELIIMFFYKTLKDVVQKSKDTLKIEDKKLAEERKREAIFVLEKLKTTILERQQFAKYKDFGSSKLSHLSIQVSKELFDYLTSPQVKQLNELLFKLTEVTFLRGVTQIMKSSFFQEKKTKDLLLDVNPILKKSIKQKQQSK